MHHNWCIGTSAVCMCLGWDVEGLVKFYTVVPAFCVPFLLQDILQCNGIFFSCSVGSCHGKDKGLMVSAMDWPRHLIFCSHSASLHQGV